MNNSITQYNNEDLQDSWQKVVAYLSNIIGEAACKSWLTNAKIESIDSHEVTISVRSNFIREWVTNHYKQLIIDAWQACGFNKLYSLCIILHKTDAISDSMSQSSSNIMQVVSTSTSNTVSDVTTQSSNQTYYSDPRFSFEQFIVDNSNEMAYTAAKDIAELKYNIPSPLYLYSQVGLGKTHLLQSIVNEVSKNKPHIKLLYISAEQFIYQFVKAIREQTIIDFKTKLHSLDILLMDDIQFLFGKTSSQEEFFACLNLLTAKGAKIVIACDRSPYDLSGLDARMRSRLGSGLVVEINQADYALRLQVVQSKLKNMQAELSLPVCEFLAKTINSNIRELEGGINKLLAYKRLIGKEIALEMATKILHDQVHAHTKQITVNDIQQRVAHYFHINFDDLLSQRRSRDLALPRHIAMYLSKIMTTQSLFNIGKAFGKSDHTSVLYAVKQIEKHLQHDKVLPATINKIKQSLEM